MTVQELVLVIAVLGVSVGLSRSVYRLFIGRRGSCVRAMVAVIGLGYGFGHVPGSTGSILLTVVGAGTALALARDATAARRRLAASLPAWIARPSSNNILDVTAGAPSIDARRRCDRARQPA